MPEKIKVLIIDDNPDFVEALKIVLINEGIYEVVSSYDGLEGLKKVHLENPDIIVLDVIMQNKDGYEICAELKSDEKYKDIPIILMTAETAHLPEIQYNPRMGMETEADAYLDKPVSPEQVLEKINKLLEK